MVTTETNDHKWICLSWLQKLFILEFENMNLLHWWAFKSIECNDFYVHCFRYILILNIKIIFIG